MRKESMLFKGQSYWERDWSLQASLSTYKGCCSLP